MGTAWGPAWAIPGLSGWCLPYLSTILFNFFSRINSLYTTETLLWTLYIRMIPQKEISFPTKQQSVWTSLLVSKKGNQKRTNLYISGSIHHAYIPFLEMQSSITVLFWHHNAAQPHPPWELVPHFLKGHLQQQDKEPRETKILTLPQLLDHSWVKHAPIWHACDPTPIQTYQLSFLGCTLTTLHLCAKTQLRAGNTLL